MDKLKFINEQMDILEIPYEFGDEWTSKVTYPYFTGEFTETPTTTEDGCEETEVILTGFHRGKYIELEEFLWANGLIRVLCYLILILDFT